MTPRGLPRAVIWFTAAGMLAGCSWFQDDTDTSGPATTTAGPELSTSEEAVCEYLANMTVDEDLAATGDAKPGARVVTMTFEEMLTSASNDAGQQASLVWLALANDNDHVLRLSEEYGAAFQAVMRRGSKYLDSYDATKEGDDQMVTSPPDASDEEIENAQELDKFIASELCNTP